MNILIVDHLNTLMRSLHVHKSLHYNDYFTGGVYGYVQQLASTVSKYNIDRVLVCKDSPPYKRKEMYKTYKGDRKEVTPDEQKELQDSTNLVEEFLKLSGFIVLAKQGYEADDLIAYTQKFYTQENHKIYIKSSDDDLHQLLDKNTVLLKNKGAIYNLRNFNRDNNFGVEDWALYTAIKGGHNNLKGLKGIGPTKAAKIILNETTLAEVLIENEAYLTMAMKLIELPFEGCEIEESKQIKFKRIEYLLFLTKLGIDPTAALTDPFTKFSGLLFK